jgi:hypothetical protein
MYFVAQPPKAKFPHYRTVVRSLNVNLGLKSNMTAIAPLQVRLASGKQMGHFFKFLQDYRGIIWAEETVSTKFWCRIEDSQYYEFKV